MEVSKCPRCGQKGFLTLRYTKYKDLRYPYIGHYDPRKKSKRTWCLIQKTQIKILKIGKFWQYRYYELIEEAVNLRENTDDRQIWIKPLEIASKLLKRHGYSKIIIESKIINDLMNEEKRKILGTHYPSKKLSQGGIIAVKQRYELLKSKIMKPTHLT